MKRVRVVHVSPAHPPTDPRIVGKQAPVLAQHYEVICLLPKADSRQSGPVRFVSLPFFRWLGWRLLLVHPLILAHILRLRPAILHIYMPELLPVAWLSRLFGVKIVYEVQENLRLKFDRKPRNRHQLFQRAFGLFDCWARRYCYHIFTEDSYLSTYTGLRLPYAVIHNYPDLTFFDTLPNANTDELLAGDGPHLLYVGIVSFDRGLDTMIRAVALLRERYPAIRLHLFGRCAFSPVQLQALPDYAAAAGNLIFYGHTDPKIAYANVRRYLAGLALLKPVGDYPGSYPTKLFEYMALKLPVITSDFPLYRAVVESADCGFCINPADTVRVAKCISQLITDPDTAAAMGQRGCQLVTSDYNWQTEADHSLRFYQKLCLRKRLWHCSNV